MVVARYLGDGSLDADFGTNGFAVPDDPRFAAASGHAIVVQSRGRIVAAGSTQHTFVLAGFDRDGRTDASFGDGGAVVTIADAAGHYDSGERAHRRR
jgi:hypothetical protein